MVTDNISFLSGQNVNGASMIKKIFLNQMEEEKTMTLHLDLVRQESCQ